MVQHIERQNLQSGLEDKTSGDGSTAKSLVAEALDDSRLESSSLPGFKKEKHGQLAFFPIKCDLARLPVSLSAWLAISRSW